jgi:hypothetical protein
MQPPGMCLLSILLTLNGTKESTPTFRQRKNQYTQHQTRGELKSRQRAVFLVNEMQVESRFLVNKKHGESSMLDDKELRFGVLQVASRVHAVEGA